MSQREDSTSPTTTKPRSGCFLGCCRFSRQKVADKSPHGDATEVNNISRKKARRFSGSLFCIKSSDTKTVPVDASTVEKVNRNEHTPFNSKTSPKRLVVPAIRDIPVSDHQTLVHDNPGQKFDDGYDRITHEEGENIILQARETSDKEESSKSKSKSRSKDRHGASLSRKSSSNQKREKAGDGEATRRQLLPSASFQMLNLERRKTAPEADRVDYSKQRRKRNASGSNRAKLEPAVGLSILMVTLIIMMVWGRLCAILCTSAWFYFIPLLRNLNNKAASQGAEGGSLSTENVEIEHEQGLGLDYKKMKRRVVLEGFLERNRRLS